MALVQVRLNRFHTAPVAERPCPTHVTHHYTTTGKVIARRRGDEARYQPAAAWAVLEACSAWRPDQADLEACLASDAFERLLSQ